MILGDDRAAAAMLRFALRSWLVGAIPEDRAAVDSGCDRLTVARLIEVGVLRRTDAGLELVWLEESREQANAFRALQSEKGKRSAQARKGRKRTQSNHGQPRLDSVEPDSTAVNRAQPVEERRVEERESNQDASHPPGDKPRAGGQGNELTRWWDAEWTRTGRPTRFDWSREAAIALANCAKKPESSVAEVKTRITRMLEKTDQWLLEGASPLLLLKHWNRFGFEVVPVQPANRQAAEMLAWAQDEDRRNGRH